MALRPVSLTAVDAGQALSSHLLTRLTLPVQLLFTTPSLQSAAGETTLQAAQQAHAALTAVQQQLPDYLVRLYVVPPSEEQRAGDERVHALFTKPLPHTMENKRGAAQWFDEDDDEDQDEDEDDENKIDLHMLLLRGDILTMSMRWVHLARHKGAQSKQSTSASRAAELLNLRKLSKYQVQGVDRPTMDDLRPMPWWEQATLLRHTRPDLYY